MSQVIHMALADQEFANGQLQGRARDSAWLRELLQPEPFVSAWEQRRVIKQDIRRCVVVIKAPNGEQVLLKCWWPSVWQRRLRAHQLQQNYQRLQYLFQHDVAIAQPLAAFTWHKRQGATGASREVWCLAQHYLAGAETLHHMLTKTYNDKLGSQTQLVDKAMQQLARVHCLGRYHGDMKLTNLMVQGDVLYLVDVSGKTSWRLKRWQQKDLARFLVGLVEAGVSKSLLATAIKSYQEAITELDADFTDGVRRLVKKIARRHARRYGNSPESVKF